jgi:hypothetical protein
MKKGNVIIYDNCMFKVIRITPNGIFADLECIYTCPLSDNLYKVGDEVRGFSFKNKKYKVLDLS